MADFVAYYRVSTDKQGIAGLGMDAQRAAVAAFVSAQGGQLLAEYTEVESGRKKDRPQLAAALDACRRRRATLVIAKLDRLARNVAFISNLMEGGAPFVAVDFPQANRFMLHMLAAFAEYEREQIGARTRAAMQAAKARGVRLGAKDTSIGLAAARPALLAARRARRASILERARPVATQMRDEGRSLRAIAAELNAAGIPTDYGRRWHASTVQRMLAVG